MITLLIWTLVFILFFYLYLFWKPQETTYLPIYNFGCLWTRWGCCADKLTVKLDQDGTNCYPKIQNYNNQ